jgi:hypothetical protein
VADRQIALQAPQVVFVEYLPHKTHLLPQPNLTFAGDSDTGAFLSTMLERVQGKVGQARDIRAG